MAFLPSSEPGPAEAETKHISESGISWWEDVSLSEISKVQRPLCLQVRGAVMFPRQHFYMPAL